MPGRSWAFTTYRAIWRRLLRYRRFLLKVPGLARANRRAVSKLRAGRLLRIQVRGFDLVVRGDDLLGREMLLHGDWEPFEVDLFASSLRPGMTVVDAGAYTGYYSLVASRAVGRAGRVLAFEPEPGNFSLLQQNLTKNGASNVEAHRIALSNGRGTASLFLSGAANCGKPSLSQLNSLTLLQENLTSDDATPFVVVKTERLEQILEERSLDHVDVLKMDVEGAEALVLEGAEPLLSGAYPMRIFMEFWPLGMTRLGADPTEVLESLGKAGFRLQVIDEESRSLYSVRVEEALASCESAAPTHQINLLCSRG